MAPKPKGSVPTGAAKATLQHKRSDVRAVVKGKVLGNFYVWTSKCPSVEADPELMFGRCLVLAGSTDQQFKLRQVDPKGQENKEFSVDPKDTFNVNDPGIDFLHIHDIGNLAHQNVAATLDYLKMRWAQKSIYTTADPLLIAINPFRDLGITTDEWIRKYRDTNNPDKLGPHVFRLAREALENYHSIDKSQTIIVTGESGAGKTEATKHVMRYFAAAKSGTSDLRIQTAVMAANPVLEAFGNAKTIRNNNSSRFGRFMQLSVGSSGGILHGMVQAFLLEKVRVVSQEKDERSYHIFYQFVKGADSSMKSKFLLKDLKQYRNLTEQSGGCFDAPGIDDLAEWKDVIESFRNMGLNQDAIDSILSILSGILMLGNAKLTGATIDGQDNAAQFHGSALDDLKMACSLLFLDGPKVQEEICSTFAKIGNENVKKRLQVPDATVMQQSLGKALYEKLFLWIIAELNKNIEPSNGFEKFMGMLDIFGFEVFEQNSLEQLLINITNEFLQKNFVDIVFEKEQKLYHSEGVSTAELKFTTNAPIIEVLIGKKSIFTTLEDACLAPGGSDQGFVNSCNNSFKTHTAYKEVLRGGVPTFTVCHSVADIAYVATGFLQKNKDLLKAELTEIVQASSNSVMKKLFEGVVVEKGKLAKGQLIASQFVRSLHALMDMILKTESHFIRCIKPNETKKPTDWNNAKVLNQLFSLSILEALQLKQLGFAYRRPFADFCKQFRYLDMAGVDSGKDRIEVAKKILQVAGIDKADFAIGKTMVFMKPDAAKLLVHRQREKMAEWQTTVRIVEASLIYLKQKKEIARLRPAAVRVQANCRWQLAAGAKGTQRRYLTTDQKERMNLVRARSMSDSIEEVARAKKKACIQVDPELTLWAVEA